MSATAATPPIPITDLSQQMMLFYQLFSATGIWLLVVGSIGTLLYNYSTLAWDFITRYLYVQLEVTDRDEEFPWLMNWIADSEYSQKATHVALLSKITNRNFGFGFYNGNSKADTVDNTNDEIVEDEASIAQGIRFIPSIGVHILSFRGTKLWIQYSKTETQSMGAISRQESISIRYLGNNRSLLHHLIANAKLNYLQKKLRKTAVYIPDMYCERWIVSAMKAKRPHHTVILKEYQWDKISEDATEFLKSRQWYSERGIPFRRGYLLFGPPGTGKTSVISALAAHLNFNICILNLSSKNLTDDLLNILMNDAPEKSIILLEDIDSAFTRQTNTESKIDEKNSNSVISSDTNNRVTYSGLLNALDGISAQEGVKIIFMTTNFRNALADSLCRSGRVDFEMEVGYADADQTMRMMKNFYPTSEQLTEEKRDVYIEQFVDSMKNYFGKFSTAELQGHLMNFKKSVREALVNISKFHEKIEIRMKREVLDTKLSFSNSQNL